MSTAVAASSQRVSRATYEQAERTLWDHYGLEPVERVVELDSPAVRLRVLEVGSGEPILFVHGTGGTGPYWGPLVRNLPGFRCLMLDRPGWAMSSPLDYSKHDYQSVITSVLRGVLDSLGIERAHVVGASIGDVWALRLAQHEPARVARVVLLGGGPLVGDVQVPGIVRLIASPLGAIMTRLPEKPGRTRSILRQIGHGASLDSGLIPDEYIAWRATLGTQTDSMRSERNMIQAIVSGRSFRPGLTFDYSELADIDHPTLLVCGTADSIAPIEVWQQFTAALPRGELKLLDGAGHLPWLDDPEGLGSEVARFLAA